MIDKAWEKLKIAFGKVGELFDVLFEELPVSMKGAMTKAKGFMKQGPNLIKIVGYALDGNQILFGQDGIPKGIMKVIGSTVGSALLGGLIQAPASGVPGLGNAVLGALAAFGGAWLGDWLGGLLWDGLEYGFNLVVEASKKLFEGIVKAAQDAANALEDQLKLGGGLFNFITGTITVYAEDAKNREQEAKIAAKFWREQFGTQYDYQLSSVARSYLN